MTGEERPSRTATDRCTRYGGAVPPDGPTPARVVTDGNGAYRRDPDGVWRYVRDGTPVPGAHDLVLGQLYAPAYADEVYRVPRQWVRATPNHPLLWVLEHADATNPRAPIAVPAPVWEERAAQVVGMLAPELHPSQLIGMDELAERSGLAPATVRAHLHRGTLPPPVARVGGSPAWTRPVVEDWLATRRRRRRPEGDASWSGDDAAAAAPTGPEPAAYGS